MTTLGTLDASLITALIAVIVLTSGAVAAFLRLRGDTRDVIEKSAKERVDDMRETADHFRGAYEAARDEAREQREQKQHALNEVQGLRLATDLTSLRKDLVSQFDSLGRRMDKVEETQRETVAALHKFEESQQAHASVLDAIAVRLAPAD